MEISVIFAIIRAFIQGIIDSVLGILQFFTIDRKINERAAFERNRRAESNKPERFNSPQIKDGKVRKRVLQCCVLNGVIFLLSLWIFEYALLPFLKYLLISLLGHSRTATTVWSWFVPILSCMFGGIWVLPMFFLSKVVNFLWCQDIADSAFWCTTGKAPFLINLSKFCADSVFSVIIQSLFLLQATIISFIPMGHLGPVLSLVHVSLLYSLYAFEYRWCKIGWELHKRLMYIEANWPYFIGFGLPLAFCTSLLHSYVQNACVFSILFPLFIISAHTAKPVTNVCNYPLRLFSIVVAVSNTICNKTLKRTSSVRTGTRPVQAANMK